MSNEILSTYMSIKYLNLTKSWVRHEDACRALANEPIPGEHIKRGPIQRVGVYSCSNYRKSREYGQTCSEGTAKTETVRGVVQRVVIKWSRTCRRILKKVGNWKGGIEQYRSPRKPRALEGLQCRNGCSRGTV